MSLELFNLSGKKALVTGGNRGLGRAIAVGLAEAGSDVAILARHRARLEAVADEVHRQGRTCHIIRADLRSLKDVKRGAGEAVDKLGRVDILVNSAGALMSKPALDVDPNDWEGMVGVNMKGLFFMSQAIALFMKDQGGGSIINLASFLGVVGTTNLVLDCATKGGVIQMTKALALEWAAFGIRVNAIAPGFFDTEFRKKYGEETYQRMVRQIPLKRMGAPHEIVGAALFLASDASSYVTGQTLLVDGGFTAK